MSDLCRAQRQTGNDRRQLIRNPLLGVITNSAVSLFNAIGFRCRLLDHDPFGHVMGTLVGNKILMLTGGFVPVVLVVPRPLVRVSVLVFHRQGLIHHGDFLEIGALKAVLDGDFLGRSSRVSFGRTGLVQSIGAGGNRDGVHIRHPVTVTDITDHVLIVSFLSSIV